MSESDLPRTCIIGAGCSGFTMAKRLQDHGLPFDCFEMSDDIGGNWYFRNPNGASSCYQSLHIDTSKWRLAFEDFPVPEDWPDFPHHAQLLQYFHDYVDHFGLRERITFETAVTHCERLDDARWRVTLSTGERRDYDAVVVANGHHWDPRLPEYPGTFDGYQVHSHHYRDPFDPFDFRGQRVLVVGAGNSAMDIASELSQRPLAERLFISMRRGVWVLPKYMDGAPADKAVLPAWMPARLGRALARAKIKKTIGRMEDYGLPRPDHEPLDAHPSVSGEFLTRAGCGDIVAKGAIDRLDGDGVVFADGSREQLDAIVWATGYNVTFPFLDQEDLTPKRTPCRSTSAWSGPDGRTCSSSASPSPCPRSSTSPSSRASSSRRRSSVTTASRRERRWSASSPRTSGSMPATSTTVRGIACRWTSTPTCAT